MKEKEEKKESNALSDVTHHVLVAQGKENSKMTLKNQETVSLDDKKIVDDAFAKEIVSFTNDDYKSFTTGLRDYALEKIRERVKKCL